LRIRIPLSTLDCEKRFLVRDGEKIGYTTAALLGRLTNGVTPPPRLMLVSPHPGVFAPKSSSGLAIAPGARARNPIAETSTGWRRPGHIQRSEFVSHSQVPAGSDWTS
jgi:hypothetical protein